MCIEDQCSCLGSCEQSPSPTPRLSSPTACCCSLHHADVGASALCMDGRWLLAVRPPGIIHPQLEPVNVQESSGHLLLEVSNSDTCTVGMCIMCSGHGLQADAVKLAKGI